MAYARTVGADDFVYDEITHWGQAPDGWSLEEVAGVAVDSRDRLFVFSRSPHPITIFDRDGQFLGSWGEGAFNRPHALYMAPDDTLFITDDNGHAIYRFTLEGQELMSIITQPSDTGYNGDMYGLTRSGAPFNTPTAATLAPDGSLFVSDGYGNARVHHFTASGELIHSWGEPGSGPGQFIVPHDVYVDHAGLVYISDRQNCRIQIFSADGSLVNMWEDIYWPCDMCHGPDGNLYIAEVGGVFMGDPDVGRPSARITVRNMDSDILCEWTEQDPLDTGRFFSPHGIAVDSHGDIYIGEVAKSYPGGRAPSDWSLLRKYIRKG
ncbi:MAG: peptidyl-alpha-hydroxyglycine alpha-amidating lyase family protein [Gemmatimonadota bacterium]|nr:peptidyl-alpha-hydroxyglycine alpha-amidating lyase family protein [Gemmatimonadota bacterium]